jgi:glycosyltransferase involved in cell wall biosynthesis
MIATVAVCTCNAASRLPRTLEALAAQQFDAGAFEVLIVDNNSRDSTHAVAKRFAAAQAGALGVRVVPEAKQGLSHARNRAIAECRGRVLAFTDDDVTPAPDWLAKLAAVYEREPRVGCAGGKIELRLPAGPLPPWYGPRLGGYLAGRDLGVDRLTECRKPWEFPYGASISFSKAALDEVGGFLTTLGRKGRGMMSGEETEMCDRLVRRGWRVFYEPAAVVQHHIPASRLQRSYFARHADGQGVMQVFWDNDATWGVSRPGQWRRYWVDFSWNLKRWLVGPARDPVERFNHYLEARKYWHALLYVAWRKRYYRDAA